MNWKYWYQISQKIKNSTYEIKKDTEYLQLQFHDYFLLHSLFNHTKPKILGYVGGFSNLDFFIPQYGLTSIEKCTNFDGTKAGDWCRQKHKDFIKKYEYAGEYIFVNKDYDNTSLEDIDFLYLHINALPSVDFSKLPKLKTLVLSYYDDCMWMNLLTDSYSKLQKKIITSHLVVYTNKQCFPVFNDCELLRKTYNTRLAYKCGDFFREDQLENVEYDENTQMCIRPNPLRLTWDEKIRHIVD
jgi:hypothetical protein